MVHKAELIALLESPAESATVEERAEEWRPEIEPHTGWVLNPALPCVKSEGLCRLRRESDVRLQCVFEPQDCEFREGGTEAVTQGR